MPTYDYICPDGHTKEVRHGMDEEPRVRCDEMVSITESPVHRPGHSVGGVGVPNRNGEAECNKPMKRQISGSFGVRVKGGTPKFHGSDKESTRSVSVSTEGVDPGGS